MGKYAGAGGVLFFDILNNELDYTSPIGTELIPWFNKSQLITERSPSFKCRMKKLVHCLEVVEIVR